MFKNLPEGPRKATALAMEEARHFGHNYIGTEHLLLGLHREGEGVAAQILTSLNVSLEELREQLALTVGYSSEQHIVWRFPPTPRSKKVIGLGFLSAQKLGEEYIDTEHLLLALVAERDGLAAIMLDNLDVEPTEVVSEVLSGRGQGAREYNAGMLFEELREEGRRLRDTGYEHSPYATVSERLRETVLYPLLAAVVLTSLVGVAVYIAIRLAHRRNRSQGRERRA